MTVETQNCRTTNNSHCYSYLYCEIRKSKKTRKAFFYYKITLRRIRITVVTLQYLYVLNVMTACLHSSPYLSSKHNACALLYCQYCPVCLYLFFSHFPINRTIFDEEMSTNFLFISCTASSETLLNLRRNQPDIVVNL